MVIELARPPGHPDAGWRSSSRWCCWCWPSPRSRWSTPSPGRWSGSPRRRGRWAPATSPSAPASGPAARWASWPSAFDEMAGRLERLVRGEKELLANVSHELRTPLARMRVALELAEEGDVARARQALGEIGDGRRRAGAAGGRDPGGGAPRPGRLGRPAAPRWRRWRPGGAARGGGPALPGPPRRAAAGPRGRGGAARSSRPTRRCSGASSATSSTTRPSTPRPTGAHRALGGRPSGAAASRSRCATGASGSRRGPAPPLHALLPHRPEPRPRHRRRRARAGAGQADRRGPRRHHRGRGPRPEGGTVFRVRLPAVGPA